MSDDDQKYPMLERREVRTFETRVKCDAEPCEGHMSFDGGSRIANRGEVSAVKTEYRHRCGVNPQHAAWLNNVYPSYEYEAVLPRYQLMPRVGGE